MSRTQTRSGEPGATWNPLHRNQGWKRGHIRLAAWAGWRARRLLRAGAVVIDVEATDFTGQIIEVAVVDARTETILLDSLVRPSVPITPEAAAVHGITDAECGTAPTWDELWPHLREVLAGRPVCAYKAEFDRGRLEADCDRAGLAMPHLRWSCVMRLNARYHGGQWRKLNGGHRAAGDALAAARLLHQIGGRP